MFFQKVGGRFPFYSAEKAVSPVFPAESPRGGKVRRAAGRWCCGHISRMTERSGRIIMFSWIFEVMRIISGLVDYVILGAEA